MNRPMDDILRTAVRKSGLPLRRVAKAAGVAQSILSMFMSGKDIRLKTAQRLVNLFDLELCKSRDTAIGEP